MITNLAINKFDTLSLNKSEFWDASTTHFQSSLAFLMCLMKKEAVLEKNSCSGS